MSELALMIVVFFNFALGIYIGVMTANNDDLSKCQKQHNVYQCKMVAVPVEK